MNAEIRSILRNTDSIAAFHGPNEAPRAPLSNKPLFERFGPLELEIQPQN